MKPYTKGIRMHENITPGPWELAENTPGLCVRGTEHLYSIVRRQTLNGMTVVTTIAENLCLADAEFILAKVNKNDDC